MTVNILTVVVLTVVEWTRCLNLDKLTSLFLESEHEQTMILFVVVVAVAVAVIVAAAVIVAVIVVKKCRFRPN